MEILKISDREILIFMWSLFIFSWKMSFVIQMLANGSQKKNPRKQKGIQQALQREKKRDKYTERKRYQHILTKLEKAIVYSSLALSTSLLNRPAAFLHQKEHWRPSSPVAEVYAVPRKTFLIVQIRSQKLLGKLARNTTMKIALTPKRRRKTRSVGWGTNWVA